MHVTGQALWFIENHLDDAGLTLEAVAEAAGVSRFHLCRAFAPDGEEDWTVSGYIRARRLSRAAEALAAGAPDILTVALEAGYGSHEAFTRAFRQQFGVSPEQVRARGSVEELAMTPARRQVPERVERLAAPGVREREATVFLGLERRYERAAERAGIPGQWREFARHCEQAAGGPEREAWGVITAGEETGFEYLCGFALAEGEGAAMAARFPAFTRRRASAGRYAVFRHEGHIAGVSGTWKAVWEYGLRDAGLTAVAGSGLIRCGLGFDERRGRGEIDLWVPVE